jgi:NAD(P)-dependent dehydrogenase (short-subunit alcohol dehydrogenase family)
VRFGYGSVGAIEETVEAEVRHHFDVHVFGPMNLIRAVLPQMRARSSGAIVNVSSLGGFVAYPGFGVCCSTKFALEGFSEALAEEVALFGIRVLIVQPEGVSDPLDGRRDAPFARPRAVPADAGGRHPDVRGRVGRDAARRRGQGGGADPPCPRRREGSSYADLPHR